MPLEYVGDDRAHCIGSDAAGIAFAPAGHAVVGCQFDKDPVSPAPTGRWRGRDDDVEIGKLQKGAPSDGWLMTDIPITIRNLGPEDVHILDRVRAGVFGNPVDPSRAFAFLATRVNEIVVALSGGEVIGFASGTVVMHPDRDPAFFVNQVSVHEGFRR